MEKQNRFVRFNPTINAGHILTAGSVIMASLLAWAQLRSDVSVLLDENKTRKTEIELISSKRETDRIDLYQKITSSQTTLDNQIKDLHTEITNRFNRLEDKLDQKEDKHNVR